GRESIVSFGTVLPWLPVVHGRQGGGRRRDRHGGRRSSLPVPWCRSHTVPWHQRQCPLGRFGRCRLARGEVPDGRGREPRRGMRRGRRGELARGVWEIELPEFGTSCRSPSMELFA